jgi:hypothetical protein
LVPAVQAFSRIRARRDERLPTTATYGTRNTPAFYPVVKGWTMGADADNVVSEKFCPRFGMIAVEMGYVSVEQVREAMAEQIDDDFANRPHRLLGTILVDRGWMTFREVEMVLEKLFKLQQQ